MADILVYRYTGSVHSSIISWDCLPLDGTGMTLGLLWVESVAGTPSFLFLCGFNVFGSPGCTARGHVFNIVSLPQCMRGPLGELFWEERETETYPCF